MTGVKLHRYLSIKATIHVSTTATFLSIQGGRCIEFSSYFLHSFTKSYFSFTFQVAKLLGTNVGTIQQDLSILLKDESIEVSKKVIFSIPK